MNFDFLPPEAKDCVPVDRLLQDPRADGFARMLEAEGLTEQYRKLWEVSGGTVLVPTTAAWDALLSDVGATASNMSEVVSSDVWSFILPSYFLSNITYMPKDVGNVLYQTPNRVLVLMSPMTEDEDADTISLVARYAKIDSTVVVPGHGTVANVTGFGTVSTVVDYSTVCTQYAVYWLDTVLHPFRDSCALTIEGCEDPELQSLEEAVDDLAPAPASSRGNRRRLLAHEPQPRHLDATPALRNVLLR